MTNQFRPHLALIGISLFAGAALTLALHSMPFFGGTAFAAEKANHSLPKSWTISSLNAIKLEALGKIDWMTVESGGEYNSETRIFEGENIVAIWDSGPAKLIFDEPSQYDEFVLVLKGELILSDNEGNSANYKQGDMFILPKGFTGTWEMPKDFRELIVIDTEAYNGAEE